MVISGYTDLAFVIGQCMEVGCVTNALEEYTPSIFRADYISNTIQMNFKLQGLLRFVAY
jgi:hypothetical protein